jgi:hypothetical protein
MPHVIVSIDSTSQFIVLSAWSFCSYLIACLILMQFSRIDFSSALAEVRLSFS